MTEVKITIHEASTPGEHNFVVKVAVVGGDHPRSVRFPASTIDEAKDLALACQRAVEDGYLDAILPEPVEAPA